MKNGLDLKSFIKVSNDIWLNKSRSNKSRLLNRKIMKKDPIIEKRAIFECIWSLFMLFLGEK